MDREQAEIHLRWLFGCYDKGWIEFRAFRGHGTVMRRSFEIGPAMADMTSVLDWIESMVIRKLNVYMGVLPRGTEDGRKKQDIVAIGRLWVDLDSKIAGAALDLLADCPVVVETGNGWHGYQGLKAAQAVGNDRDREAKESKVRRWQITIHPESDPTHDLARILRVAGTVNFKDPVNPKPVNLLRWPEQQPKVEVPGEKLTSRERLGTNRIDAPPDWTAADQDKHEWVHAKGYESDKRIPDLRLLHAELPWPEEDVYRQHDEWLERILLRMAARGDRWGDMVGYAIASGRDEGWVERKLREFADMQSR